MKAHSLSLPALSAIVIVGLGCAHEQKPRVATTHTTSYSQPAPAHKTTPKTVTLPPKRTGNLTISGELAQACNIDFDTVARAPKFAFDDSSLQPTDESVLQQLATCVATGPLKGRALKLVGRADPRGEEEYNFSLGERRASSVGNYLRQLGVDQDRITETSRGKLDAAGTDEESWQQDRRVDIVLE